MKLLLINVFVLIVLIGLVCVALKYERSSNNGAITPIYCIMITGKDADRIQYARKSMANFLEQTYENKVLVIVNHHPELRVLDSGTEHDNIFEFEVSKEGKTLGDLRNIALQLVAANAWWTVWDDDDYRSAGYLAELASHKTDDNVVSVSRRLEYNKNNGASWMSTKHDGFILVLASFDNRVVYKKLDTFEDMDLLEDFKKVGYKIKVVVNDPKMYVRLVHTNNTSLYVKKNRDYLVKGPTYKERFTTDEEKQYIQSVLPKLLID